MARSSARLRRCRLTGALAVVALVAAAGCRGSGGDDTPDVAARVDGTTISSSRVQELADQYSAAAVEEDDEALSDNSARRLALDFLIRLTYLQVLAEDRAVTPAANTTLERILSATTPDDFAGTGWTPDDLRNGTAAGELSKGLAAEVFPEVAVAESEAQRRYEEQQARFQAGWSAAVHVAYLPTEEAAGKLQGSGDPAQFDARAEALGASQSGSMGTVTSATSLPPDVLAAIAAAPVGGVSAPVAAGGGWLAFFVASRDEVPATAPDEALEQVRSTLEDEKRQQLFEAWFSDRLEAAAVEVDPFYGQWDETVGAVR